jgi:hypothetical protein
MICNDGTEWLEQECMASAQASSNRISEVDGA